ncbi:uncharacterized protein LY79DRAFT_139125 [Colletotrichum navitas]|uniref:Uncharacterized protein n=1 Tax=Colletotrichum navitas TaxID=681940 RepID=A0AAD8QE27_9PEZI|nr:uncharacterized protein LY79DRAFT_139125 [Colletotrichum navitas]KAK1599384.1 hypothetical protein LY79DRAFT_139125 [Colletotrichum navitas]
MAAALRFTYLPIIPSPSPTPTFMILTHTSIVLTADRVPSMTTVVSLGPRAASYTTVYVTPTTSAPEEPEHRDPVYGDLTWSYVVLICVPFVVLAVALYSNHRDRHRRVSNQDIEMQSFQKFWFPWRELDPGEVPNEIYGRTGSRRNADPEELTKVDDETASDNDSVTATTGRASPDIGPWISSVRGGGNTEAASPNPWAAHIPSYYGNLPLPVSPVSKPSPSQGNGATGAGSSNTVEAQVQAEIPTTVQRRADRSRNRFDLSSSEDETGGQPAEPQHSYYADPSTRAGKRPVKP